MPTLVLENGSGLSRNCRVSASGLIHLLEKGWQSSYRPEFLSSLPIASIDGTMENRLEKEKPAGRVRIKTGLLDHVRSMAGYVTSEEGNRYLVALLVNHPLVDYESGNQVQDALLRWILRH
jgi:D-alanyl-D-alanine carboxypeptidase/D-alanyl-D-alanine-endopeptidase (penicillin-binding protein 4)